MFSLHLCLTIHYLYLIITSFKIMVMKVQYTLKIICNLTNKGHDFFIIVPGIYYNISSLYNNVFMSIILRVKE